MRLELSYRSEYRYDPPVADGITAVRLVPVTRPGLLVDRAELKVTHGHVSATYVDGWGTRVDLVEARGAHTSAVIHLHASVETQNIEQDLAPSPAEVVLYSGDSERAPRSAIASLGWNVATEGLSWTSVESALAWMPQRFTYQVGATDARTRVEEVIGLGAGVCQDFAHVYLALLRSWGWCARYVSGYFFNASPDQARIEAEATHAWVEVYRPGMGWIGLDPTAGQYSDERYVAIGRGRDYDDVRPIRGVVEGASTQVQDSKLIIHNTAQSQTAVGA